MELLNYSIMAFILGLPFYVWAEKRAFDQSKQDRGFDSFGQKILTEAGNRLVRWVAYLFFIAGSIFIFTAILIDNSAISWVAIIIIAIALEVRSRRKRKST